MGEGSEGRDTRLACPLEGERTSVSDQHHEQSSAIFFHRWPPGPGKRAEGLSGLTDFARGDRDSGDLIDGERCLLEEVAVFR